MNRRWLSVERARDVYGVSLKLASNAVDYTIDAGETPLDAAVRELAEEVGGIAQSIEPLGMFFPSAAHLRLECNIFLARGVTLGPPNQEAIELMTIHTFSKNEAFALARSGAMEAQSALAVLMAEPLLRD